MPDARVVRLPLERRSERAPAPAPRGQADVQSAIVAGQLAGFAMMGALAIVGLLLRGRQLLFPLQVVAAVFLGDQALGEPTAGNLFTGAVAHQLGPTLFWSLVYGVAATRLRARRSTATAVMLGLFVGALALVVDVYGAVPRVARVLEGHNAWAEQVPIVWSWGAHLLYGLALGVFFVSVHDRVGRGAAAQRAL